MPDPRPGALSGCSARSFLANPDLATPAGQREGQASSIVPAVLHARLASIDRACATKGGRCAVWSASLCPARSVGPPCTPRTQKDCPAGAARRSGGLHAHTGRVEGAPHAHGTRIAPGPLRNGHRMKGGSLSLSLYPRSSPPPLPSPVLGHFSFFLAPSPLTQDSPLDPSHHPRSHHRSQIPPSPSSMPQSPPCPPVLGLLLFYLEAPSHVTQDSPPFSSRNPVLSIPQSPHPALSWVTLSPHRPKRGLWGLAVMRNSDQDPIRFEVQGSRS